eukprot:TRINITY_DN2684_c0_g1_i1.p1 TRINITY_DN2684_c0_g1~~TRINITY_DN2684_c0_g1_i1.p1  ORF type:complete len:480 (+),score=213.59 TRINITY_DN2684_c0_g1_i1:115-1554(+)
MAETNNNIDNNNDNIDNKDITNEKLFEDIDSEHLPTIISSLCMNCHGEGETRLLLTKIPYFREVVLIAFHCNVCSYRNNEIQAASEIQERGCRITLVARQREDLNRQIVKSEFASIFFKEIDFEIPATTQKGTLNTVEGFLVQAFDGLKANQDILKEQDPVTAAKVDAFCEQLQSLIDAANFPFTLIVDDPSGNSFIQNLKAPLSDPDVHEQFYIRNRDQNHLVGIYDEKDIETEQSIEIKSEDKKEQQQQNNSDTETNSKNLREEAFSMDNPCYACMRLGKVNMCMIDIPHFKEVVVISFFCEYCGYKSSEIKAGGGISPKGKKIILRVESPEDMSRDILKSETAHIIIPELELELQGTSLGSKFTTIEGLMNDVISVIKKNPFASCESRYGDSEESANLKALDKFFNQMEIFASGKQCFTFILDDPLGNIYIQNLYAPDPDPSLTIVEYERTWEQDEEFGLNQIRTENYSDSNQSNS